MTLINKSHTLLLTLAILGFSGCTSPLDLDAPATPSSSQYVQAVDVQPSPEKLTLYKKTMRSIGENIQHDENYERIAFATKEEKAWFKTLTYKLWDKQITRHQFLEEGLSKYPDHSYEFEFIIKQFMLYGNE